MFLAIPPLVAALLVARGERAHYLQRVAPTVLGGAVFAGLLLAEGYGTLLVASQSSLDATGLGMRVVANAKIVREWFMPLLTPAIVWLAAGGVLCAFVRRLGHRRRSVFLVALVVLVRPAVRDGLDEVVSALRPLPRRARDSVGGADRSCPRGDRRSAAGEGVRIGRAHRRQRGHRGNSAGAMVTCLPRILTVIMDPTRAVLPFVERSMYIDGTSSGYGLPELAAFLAEQAERSAINVVRFTRTPAKEAIRLYLPATVSAQVHLLDPPPEPVADQIAKLADVRRTLLIVDQELDHPAAASQGPVLNARQIWSHTRPGGETRLEVWEMPPA
jgi:hypothetical protein